MAVNLKIVSQVVASGTPGPAGKSAYQIAVDNGFEGTESEWLKELHPFKGWFDSVSELEEEHSAPSVGEYAYVKGATSSDPVKIYECSTEGSWSDSGRTVDTTTVQTFRSGEAVNDVDITDDSSEIEENSDKIPTAGAVANALGNVKFSTGEKVKNVGIDAEPTAGSNNLVKSGGTADFNNNVREVLGLEVVPIEMVLNTGSIYNGAIDISSKNCLYSQRIKVCPGKKLKCICASDITIRITEYSSDTGGYIKDTGSYRIIDTLLLDNETQYVVISASYSQRGYSSSNPVTSSDFTEGDFGVLSPIITNIDDYPKANSNLPAKSGGMSKSLPLTIIDNQYLTQGSIYNGSIVTSGVTISTLLYYRVAPNNIVSFKALHNNESFKCRYSFYDINKTWLSQTEYLTEDVQVPDNAYYCRFSFGYSTTITPDSILHGEISVTAIDAYNPRVNNGGSSIGAVFGTGKINFDNVTKKVIIVGGNLAFIKDGKRISIPENTYIDYENYISPTFGASIFLAINGNNELCFVNPSTNNPQVGYNTNITLFADNIILAVIQNIITDIIKVESIKFCATRYTIDGVDYGLASLPQMFNISNTLLAQGGLYNGAVMTDTKKVHTPAKYICKGNAYLYLQVYQANYTGCRIVWYDIDGTVITNTSYSDDLLREIPSNAYYFQLAFAFSEDTTPSDITEGAISCSVMTENPLGINNNASVVLPFYSGHLNFDNTNKKIQILGGSIGYIKGNKIKTIAENTEFNYASSLTPSSGNSHYLIINDNNEITTVVINNVQLNKIKDANIIGTIVLSSPQTVEKENIRFCSIPFTIDNNINIDYSILKSYCSHFNVDNAIDSFIFFTDPHIFNLGFVELKDDKYIKTIKNYYEATPTSNCICGGDWMNHESDEEEAIKILGYIDGFMNENFKNYIPIVGNHDYNKYQTEHVKLKNQSLVNLWYRNIGKTYFYTENKANNSRFYFFDSGIDNDYSTMDVHKWEQINWFATELLNNVSHNIIFVHISYIADYLIPFVDNLTALADAYNNKATIILNDITYDFSNCTGSVSCVISGHRHGDYIYTANNIPVVITTDLRHSGVPSFDLCTVDYVAKKLYMTRVGDGNSREIDII